MPELLKQMIDLFASDLHLTAGAPPLFRVDGRLRPMSADKLNADQILKLSYSVMNEQQKKTFEQKKEVDFSFGIQNLSRFRANVYLQRGCTAGAFRQIPYLVQPLEKLGLPTSILGRIEQPGTKLGRLRPAVAAATPAWPAARSE